MRSLREVAIDLYTTLTKEVEDPFDWESYPDPSMGPLLEELRAVLGRPSTLTIAVEDVDALQEHRRRINQIPLEQITWTLGGRTINVTPKQIEDFKFTGLSNIDFVDMRWWLGPERLRSK